MKVRSLTAETAAVTCYRSACDKPIKVVGRTKPINGFSRNVEGFCSKQCAAWARYRASTERAKTVFRHLRNLTIEADGSRVWAYRDHEIRTSPGGLGMYAYSGPATLGGGCWSLADAKAAVDRAIRQAPK